MRGEKREALDIFVFVVGFEHKYMHIPLLCFTPSLLFFLIYFNTHIHILLSVYMYIYYYYCVVVVVVVICIVIYYMYFCSRHTYTFTRIYTPIFFTHISPCTYIDFLPHSMLKIRFNLNPMVHEKKTSSFFESQLFAEIKDLF